MVLYGLTVMVRGLHRILGRLPMRESKGQANSLLWAGYSNHGNGRGRKSLKNSKPHLKVSENVVHYKSLLEKCL